MVQDKSNKQIYFSWQVLEYHPEPWNQWVTVGNILVARVGHTVLSIGPQQLPCASGDDKKPTATNKILVCLLVTTQIWNYERVSDVNSIVFFYSRSNRVVSTLLYPYLCWYDVETGYRVVQCIVQCLPVTRVSNMLGLGEDEFYTLGKLNSLTAMP